MVPPADVDVQAFLLFGAIFLACALLGGIAFWMTERVATASVAWAAAFVLVGISLTFGPAISFGVGALAGIATYRVTGNLPTALLFGTIVILVVGYAAAGL